MEAVEVIKSTDSLEAEALSATPTATGADRFARCGSHYGLLAFGWFNVLLGAVGVMVPGLPTTIFLLMALWAFSKC